MNTEMICYNSSLQVCDKGISVRSCNEKLCLNEKNDEQMGKKQSFFAVKKKLARAPVGVDTFNSLILNFDPNLLYPL